VYCSIERQVLAAERGCLMIQQATPTLESVMTRRYAKVIRWQTGGRSNHPVLKLCWMLGVVPKNKRLKYKLFKIPKSSLVYIDIYREVLEKMRHMFGTWNVRNLLPVAPEKSFITQLLYCRGSGQTGDWMDRWILNMGHWMLLTVNREEMRKWVKL